MLFSDIFVLIVDYIDENMIQTANNNTLDLFDHDEHNYDDKTLSNINYASLLCLRFNMMYNKQIREHTAKNAKSIRHFLFSEKMQV